VANGATNRVFHLQLCFDRSDCSLALLPSADFDKLATAQQSRDHKDSPIEAYISKNLLCPSSAAAKPATLGLQSTIELRLWSGVGTNYGIPTILGASCSFLFDNNHLQDRRTPCRKAVSVACAAHNAPLESSHFGGHPDDTAHRCGGQRGKLGSNFLTKGEQNRKV